MPKKRIPIAMLLLIAMAVLARADGGSGPEVQGIIGITPVPEGSCLAVYVPMPQDRALAGVMWYNNDETVVFPAVLIASGVAGIPEPVSAAFPVAENVSGASSGWSELEFTEPVAALDDGFYIVFRLPEGSEHTANGHGGGAGIGYTEGENGFTGWISIDGDDWVKLQASFGMAILPIMVERADGMVEKDAAEDAETPVTHTAFLLPSPNPFNPQTELRFQLKERSDVDLSIYNVKGERVARLATGPHAAGRYTIPWRGVDAAGQRLASGTYIARFVADHVVQTQRLTLVK